MKAALRGFLEARMLADVYVTIASIPGSLLDRMGGVGPFSEIRRRRFDPLLKSHIHTWPWFELGRLLALKAGLKKLTKAETGLFHVDAVLQNLDKYVAKNLKHAQSKGITAIYSYEDTALHTFRKAKNLGLQCLYDLPIGYWKSARKLLDAERDRWPDWVSTMPGLSDAEQKLANKDEELELADQIFVASTFTANSLKEYSGKLAPVEIIPYGFSTVSKETRNYVDFKTKRRLKLLFVGSLSQRKGVADLFSAVEKFGNSVELTLVGRKPTDECKALNAALSCHRWIPSLSHHEVLKLMRESDVLVFPSLFEGFGLVITEAMSQGTPVITTDRTAGPDIIEHGKNGWLLKAGVPFSLENTLEEILKKTEIIRDFGQAAMETARLRPWESYGRELAVAVNRIL
ncbi:MAG: glycosyltransferase family 4 protein [Ferruginibacter sp.]